MLDANCQPVFTKASYGRKPKPKMRFVGKIFHDFRRTGVRNLLRAGVDRETAKLISGHRSDSVFARYNISDKRDILEAGKLQDAYNAEQAAEAAAAASDVVVRASGEIRWDSENTPQSETALVN